MRKLIIAAALLLSASTSAEAPRAVALFSISKSENKNVIVYAVHVDDHCVPLGPAPLYAYWRMDQTDGAIQAILGREERLYGIAQQHVMERTDHGGAVDLTLRPLAARHILVETEEQGGTCRARSIAPIAGVTANLESVYVKLKFLGVEEVVLSGRTADGVIREHIIH